MNMNKQCKGFTKKYDFAIVLLAVAMLFPFSLFAQPSGYMGGHMMDEETREKMMEEGGYPYGRGYGGHMMGGGPGWMGGMMGRMMGGGFGPMMMGSLNQLDLTKEQRVKIRDIQRSMRKKNIGLMEKMMDRSARLEDLYDSEKLDTDKIGKAYDLLYKIKRKMLLRHVEARNKMYDVLNKEQRENFKSYGSLGHMSGMMMY